jgi:hypothetical protein
VGARRECTWILELAGSAGVPMCASRMAFCDCSLLELLPQGLVDVAQNVARQQGTRSF